MKELHCCSLNLEFEELEDVVFSVFGPWGVYLAGCYLDPCRTTCDGANGFIMYPTLNDIFFGLLYLLFVTLIQLEKHW
jgi:hypothetical protein